MADTETAENMEGLPVFHEAPSGLKQLEQAHEATRIEHDTTVWQAVISNTKIILLSIFSNIGFFAYGFDAMAFSICLSMIPFQKTFGNLSGESYIIPAYWQSLWGAVTQATTMVGACFTGLIADRFGRKFVMFTGAAISMCGIGITYTAAKPGVYLAGKMVNGFGVGLINTIGSIYISEITPLRLRGICLSALIFSTVLFATGWIWPGIVIVVSPFIPESPHYLVHTGQLDKARAMLQRLRPQEKNVDALLDEIVVTHSHERSLAQLKGSAFVACFQGTNWRRTRIILYLNAMGQLIGAAFVNNAPYFLVQAGMSSSKSSMIIEIGFALGIMTSAVAWLFMDSLGRRAVLNVGLVAAVVMFLAMGIAGCFPGNSSAEWAVGILILLVISTNGPVTGAATSIAGEISQTELRAMTQTIGFAFNFFFGTVWQVVVPYMFNSDEGNLGGKMGWIFFATSLFGLLIVYWEVPETRDRTYGELDEMFEIKVPTKDFKNYVINHV